MPEARGLVPDLSLEYNSGGGNGPFGIGFDISIPSISRRTDAAIPKYQDSDTFVLSEVGMLTPKMLVTARDERQRDVKRVSEGDRIWEVLSYLPEHEEFFSSIEFWTNSDSGESHWRVLSRENTLSIFGLSANSRISDPEDSRRIFQWLLEESRDSRGNKISYRYKQENSENVAQTISEVNRSATANKYVESIRYGNYWIEDAGGKKEEEEQFAYELVFDHGEYDLDQPDAPPGQWKARKDPFSTYRAGFEIRTYRLCRNILRFHRFKHSFDGERFLVRALHLEYEESESLSYLKSVAEIGFRKDVDAKQPTPPVELTFSRFNPANHELKPLHVDSDGTIPGYLTKGLYLPVDLYGEGLPGFLYSDNSTTLYWDPKGDGHFVGPTPRQFPADRNLSESTTLLMDLEANGQLQLVVNDPLRSGYYEIHKNDRSLTGYQRFNSYPLEFANPQHEVVDLGGSGLSDLLFWGSDWLRFYPAEGKRGFAAAHLLARTRGLPAPSESDREVVTFADMFGDGLEHRVRIRDGIIECWPNLGYGRFGAKITFGNSPRFGAKADNSRLFLADVDGSGTMDLLYVRGDRLEIFLNESGNSFGNPITLPLPITVTDIDQISFADVLGIGASSLVLTKIEPEVSHFYYDFTGGVKPYLLVGIDNNFGGSTAIKYCSSTRFYLEDREAGRPWITSLPFPVQVVEKVESIDRVSGSKLVNLFKYHHGYFDPVTREFNGFGFVERWDTEDFGIFSEPGLHESVPFEPGDAELHTPAAHHKAWYHTGAYLEGDVLAQQYEKEYFQGDRMACRLGPGVLALPPDESDFKTIRQANRALKGKSIREEVYSENGIEELAHNPYLVTQRSYEVRLLQPREERFPAVFFVYDRETISYEYEREPHDPRVRHDFTLTVDHFGNVLSHCQVFYPRRTKLNASINLIDDVYAEQTKLRVTAGVDRYLNVTEGRRWLGVPCEGKVLELSGLSAPVNLYFGFAEIKPLVDAALLNEIPFGQPFTPGVLAARAFDAERHYYWNESLTAPLPLGAALPERALLHHVEEAILTPGLVARVFSDKVTNEMLSSTAPSGGGYISSDGYWWDPGQIANYYDTEQSFYQLWKTEDHFGGRTTIEYDPYSLNIVKISEQVTDTEYNLISATIDYHTLEPAEIIDENDNHAQFLFDPLGNVVITSEFGKTDGRPEGDEQLSAYVRRTDATFADVVMRPHWYLQKATTFIFYDLFAWMDRRVPASAVELSRFTHVSDLLPGEESAILTEVTYIDGFDRVAEKRVRGDATAPFSDIRSGERWIVSGRIVYNNKALPVKQYLPYFSTGGEYGVPADILDLVPPPTVTHYDPLMRAIRVDTPKGFFQKFEFRPWALLLHDEDDTVKDSLYYQEHINDPLLPPDEKDALKKAALFFDTPEEKVLDNAGRTFLSVQINIAESDRALKREYLITRYELDVYGNTLQSLDPRSVRVSNVVDMRSRVLSTNSPDAGLKLSLDNVFDNTIHSWDKRGFHTQLSYDRLQRPVEVRITGDDRCHLILDHVVQRIVYGEERSDSTDKNLRGEVYEYFDEAGLTTFGPYNIQRQPLMFSRRLLADYKHEVNWNNKLIGLLEPEPFVTQNAYNAFGDIVSQTTPDGSISRTVYGEFAWPKKISVTFADKSEQTFIADVQYDAAGQRQRIDYGNGATTTFNYEWTTQRLVKILTKRSGSDARGGARESTLQNISYFYDPVGNVTRTCDYTHQTVFCDQQKVEALSDYVYDALYRLIHSSGRQHPGIQQNTHVHGFKQSLYMPLCQQPHPNDFQQLQIYSEDYTYDASGNLTRLRHYAPQSTLSWTRDINILPESNRMQGTNYDANGNPFALENLREISWNYRNNIARVDLITRDDAISDSDYYVYDYAGNRIRKVVERFTYGGSVTRIEETIYLGNLVLRREKRETVQDKFATLERQSLHVMDGDNRVAISHSWPQSDYPHQPKTREAARQIRYQLSNVLNSSVIEVDANADIISFEEYFPYGGTSVIAGNDQAEVALKDYRYSGKEADDSTGLYYYGARYYVTWLARWLSPDPSGTGDGLNLYQFVGGNPLTFTDNDGEAKRKLKVARTGGGHRIRVGSKSLLNVVKTVANEIAAVATVGAAIPAVNVNGAYQITSQKDWLRVHNNVMTVGNPNFSVSVANQELQAVMQADYNIKTPPGGGVKGSYNNLVNHVESVNNPITEQQVAQDMLDVAKAGGLVNFANYTAKQAKVVKMFPTVLLLAETFRAKIGLILGMIEIDNIANGLSTFRKAFARGDKGRRSYFVGAQKGGAKALRTLYNQPAATAKLKRERNLVVRSVGRFLRRKLAGQTFASKQAFNVEARRVLRKKFRKF